MKTATITITVNISSGNKWEGNSEHKVEVPLNNKILKAQTHWHELNSYGSSRLKRDLDGGFDKLVLDAIRNYKESNQAE